MKRIISTFITESELLRLAQRIATEQQEETLAPEDYVVASVGFRPGHGLAIQLSRKQQEDVRGAG